MIALQSSRADPEEWGATAGVVQAVGALASGCGPLLFAGLFSYFSTGQAQGRPFFPEVRAGWIEVFSGWR
jgi:hypothetical protein